MEYTIYIIIFIIYEKQAVIFDISLS